MIFGLEKSSDFELQKRTVRRGENPLGKSLVIDGFQNAEFRGYRIALVPLFHKEQFEITQVANRNFVETDIGRAELLQE